MDPSWYYKSLSNAPGSYQSGTGAGASEYQQLAGHQPGGGSSTTPASTSQLLLQAAAHNTNLPSPAFNSGFLTPNPYDFPPLFPHASKNSPYAGVSSHRALASAMASSKPASEGDLSALRENYSPAHHPSLASSGSSYFDQQSPVSSSVGWSHQSSSQLPFGILPHQSVAASSSAASPKTGSSEYHLNPYASPQHLSQLAEYKAAVSSSYADSKRGSRSQSPASSSKTSLAGSSSAMAYQGPAGALSNYNVTDAGSRTAYSSSSKYSGSSSTQQPQTCIVPSPSVTPPTKDFRMQQSSSRHVSSHGYHDPTGSRDKHPNSRSPNVVPPVSKSTQPANSHLTKAQSKAYPDFRGASESSLSLDASVETNQSSPISYSMMDSRSTHRYTTGCADVPTSVKHVSSNNHAQRGSGSQSVNQPYHPTPNHQELYRHYNTSGAADTEYHRSKSSSSVESGYSAVPQQNGVECAVSQRRSSPHVTHSQPSPLGQVQSPAYPMYSSPLAPMASPTPLQHSESINPCHQTGSTPYKPSSQVNLSSPLDVSMSRSQAPQSQSVAYPSVITRVSDPIQKPTSYDVTRPYERNQETVEYAKQCWDSASDRQSEHQGTSSHQRKYHPPTNPVPAYSTPEVTESMPTQNHVSRAAVSSERQHSYYEPTAAHSMPLQDLTSCRGDPMSIVKNLQNLQQQTFQVLPSPDDSRSESKGSNSGLNPHSGSSKKKRSADKPIHTPNNSDYYSSRVPPPAHHNASPQQQQNGSYFSNFLSNPSTSRPHSASQTPVHASSTHIGNQHQSLYMPQFFPPFSHSGPNSSSSNSQPAASNEYQSPAAHSQMTHSGSDPISDSRSQVKEHKSVVENSPKLVIPDIEEELSFLASFGPIMMIKSELGKTKSNSSGFESSYLKFLQGERDVSPPPPANKGGRKSAWSKPVVKVEESKSAIESTSSANGSPTNVSVVPSSPSATDKEKSADYDPEDDPRYFPLPKTDAQRRSLDTSDSDSNSTEPKLKKVQPSKGQDCKPVATVAPRTANKQSSKSNPVPNHQPAKRGRKKKPEAPVPRRETSKRKAKEKGSILLGGDDDDPDGREDSDSDPAWTPVTTKARTHSVNHIDTSDDEFVKKKKKGGGKVSAGGRKRPKNVLSDDDDDGNKSSEEEKPKKRSSGMKKRRRSGNIDGTGGNSASTKSGDDTGDVDDADIYPFKIGEFVVMKSDLNKKLPTIWRVDGKTLLQKFEPFEQKGETLYRNISTYSGWSPQNRQVYCSAEVRFRVNNRTETIVEYLPDQMPEDNKEMLEAFVNETAKYQDNFEVYIQTLISQALDSNFLTEIFQEQDEYFLSNVKTVDDIVDDRRKRFLSIVKWRPELEASIATWPCYNVIFELVGEEFFKNCAACDKPRISARVLLYGQPYNSTTLEGCQADPKLVCEKDFLTCRLCLSRIELYNKVAHQKYLMYIECAKRVNEKRLADSSKDTTVVLNELLADEKWLNELFRKVRTSWAEIDCLEQIMLKQ